MIEVRRSEDRGRTRLSWLDSRHSFSFGAYRDPRHMGFRGLRVINEDEVAPSGGFGKHPHRDMEILSFVRSGALAHEDSTGESSVLRPGDVQRMTAGSGVVHSEVNASSGDPVRFFQVWIEPAEGGLEPGYEERRFDEGFGLVASPDGRDGSLSLHADALVHRGRLEAGEEIRHPLPGRHAWLQIAGGEVFAQGQRLGEGDAIAVSDQHEIHVRASEASELLLFDLA